MGDYPAPQKVWGIPEFWIPISPALVLMHPQAVVQPHAHAPARKSSLGGTMVWFLAHV